MSASRHTLATAALVLLAACATDPANAQDRAADTMRASDEPLPSLVVFEFDTVRAADEGGQDQSRDQQSREQRSSEAQQADPISIAGILARADAPELARLVLRDPPDAPASAEGTLLFGDVAELARWRQTRMEDFLAPMGGADAVATTVRVVNHDVLAAYGLGGPRTGLENLSITYTNTGNDTGGADADIDAVTVVCPGDFAECSPNN